MPPMMPLLHDALWFGAFAALALFAWKAAERFDLRLPSLAFRWPARDAMVAAAPTAWFNAAPPSSGNTAFDEWRDGEIARIEAQREVLEVRLRDFQAFVDKLRRAKDRETFERFKSEHDDASAGAAS